MIERRPRLLVAVDFSVGALGALRAGQWLASRAGLDMRLLHAAESGTPWTPNESEWEWMRTARVEPGHLLVRPGRPWIEIVRYANEIGATAIVLGSHGASGMQSMALGSTAGRVALRAPCPVVFAPPLTFELPAIPQLSPSKERLCPSNVGASRLPPRF